VWGVGFIMWKVRWGVLMRGKEEVCCVGVEGRSVAGYVWLVF